MTILTEFENAGFMKDSMVTKVQKKAYSFYNTGT